ncbi:MAG: MvaI/BcnI family restriction endonuclease [Acidimicrobiaceae bacterium]|nr:MvaI/BcnI family restriction endonuclease [Acidimicrobiaceae bacterium]
MKIFTKESLMLELDQIRKRGWIKTHRRGNDGGVGNTLEDLLGIEENNLPLPNAGEWEIKGQRAGTTSLITLFHMEPSPRAMKFVPRVLLPKYGWPHQQAGDNHPKGEMSFRQTISVGSCSNRGFSVKINHEKGPR